MPEELGKDGKPIQTVTSPNAGTPVVPPAAGETEKSKPVVDDIEKKISDAVAKAQEKAQREIQSVKDKAIAEIATVKRESEVYANKIKAKVIAVNPEMEEALQLAQYQAREEAQKEAMTQAQMTAAQKAAADEAHEALVQTLKDAGIDENDPNVDWGTGSKSYGEGLKRFQKSIVNILKTRDSAKEQGFQTQMAQMKTEIETKIRGELGLQTVNPSLSGATVPVSSSTIPTNMAEFKQWVADLPQVEYEKRATEIRKMLDEGKIK